MIEINDREFKLLKEHLYRISGIDVPQNKQYLFNTRLAKYLEEQGCKSFSDFYNRLVVAKDDVLQRHFIQEMTTHESSFVRDINPFLIFEKKILPKMGKQKIAEAKFMPPTIKILSAGCSLGQEPYSIAMIVHKWLGTQKVFCKEFVSITAVDISRKILERAKKGIYLDNEIGKGISPEFMEGYFTRQGGHWAVKSIIKSMVNFKELNLAEPFTFIGTFDVIFCRNVIIYFPIELKKRIIRQFYEMLNPAGVFIMGASESIYNISDDFVTIHEGSSIYYIRK